MTAELSTSYSLTYKLARKQTNITLGPRRRADTMRLITLVIAIFGNISIVQLASVPSKDVLLLRQKEPLQLEYCKKLGYKETCKINFMKKSQSEAQNDGLYNALLLLDRMGCSELVRGFACAIYAPAFLKEYKTALPPCRSLCKRTAKQCSKFIPYMKKMFSKGKEACKVF